MTEPASIGEARMAPDGTITLQLRAESTTRRVVGDGLFTYEPSHPDYQSILDHLGDLAPGESRPVPPWPDS
jgi:hypothetical protein